jgi:hypothetical protein
MEKLATVDYEVNTLDPAFPWVRLSYTITSTPSETERELMIRMLRQAAEATGRSRASDNVRKVAHIRQG